MLEGDSKRPGNKGLRLTNHPFARSFRSQVRKVSRPLYLDFYMLVEKYPNSEIELTFDFTDYRKRAERETSRRGLDINPPVRTEQRDRLKSRSVTGFGKAHRGKGRYRSGTSRRVQRLCGALEAECEQTGKVPVFITITCPGSSLPAMEVFSAWSGYLLDCLNNWLRKKQERYSGVPGFLRLHVWELQKRGAEHLHYVCALSEPVYLSVVKEFRKWIYEVFSRISSLAGQDIFQKKNSGGTWRGSPGVLQFVVEKVRSSLSSYLSKYLLKNVSQGSRGFISPLIPRPARIWGASRVLRGVLRKHSTSRYWSLERGDAVIYSRLLVELAQNQGIAYSENTSHAGNFQRVRFFFSGEKLLQDEFFDFVKEVVGPGERAKRDIGKEINMVARLFRKCQRIAGNGKKRKAFDDYYGKVMTKVNIAWFNSQPISPFEMDLLITCLQSFDEVLLKDSRTVNPLSVDDKKTQEQLVLELFPSPS